MATFIRDTKAENIKIDDKKSDIPKNDNINKKNLNKENGICSAQRIEQQLCDEKPTNAEIAVFLCRKLLLFGVRCGIMTVSDKMH